MLKTLDSQSPRVVEIRRSARPEQRHLSVTQMEPRPLKSVLSGLRAEMDGLTIRLAREHGVASQATVRAEQISHAIQRLEWALDRQPGDPEAS